MLKLIGCVQSLVWLAAVVVCCVALVLDVVGDPLTLQTIDCPSVSA